MWPVDGGFVLLIGQSGYERSLLINGDFLRENVRNVSNLNEFVVFSDSTRYRISERHVDEEQPVACLNRKFDKVEGAIVSAPVLIVRDLLLLQNLLLIRP